MQRKRKLSKTYYNFFFFKCKEDKQTDDLFSFSFSAARESQELLELLGLPDIKDLLASPVSVV